MVALFAASLLVGADLKGTDLSRPLLLSEVTRFQPGKSFLVGIHFRMKPGWHIYWQNPGDSGQEVRVQWILPKGWKVSHLMWPTPDVLSDVGLTMYVYSNEVTLLARLTPPLSSRQAKLSAHLDWLVCERICLPAKTDLAMVLDGSSRATVNPKASALIGKVLASLPKPFVAGDANAVLNKSEIVLTAKLPRSGYTSFRFLPSDTGVIQNQPQAVARATGDTVTLRLRRSEYFNMSTTRLRGILEASAPGASSFVKQIDVPLDSPAGKTQ